MELVVYGVRILLIGMQTPPHTWAALVENNPTVNTSKPIT